MLSTARYEFREIGRWLVTGEKGQVMGGEIMKLLPDDYLEQLKAEYPRRNGDNGWIHVRTLIPRAITAGATWERILAGTKAYKAHCDATGKTGTELVKQARTFFGPGMYFDEWADMQPVKTPQQVATERRWEALKERANRAGFRAPTAVESPDVYETALRQFEREKQPQRDMGVVLQLAASKRL